MPLVAHNDLPTFERLRREGQTILSADRAAHQEIRELHIGLLNMMPDAALEATERQFFRLVGESNPIAQFYVHPFTLDALPRGAKAREHIERYYEPFAAVRDAGLDALIITGANVTHPDLAQEPFWTPLIEVIDWAMDNVTSTLCSCLATHAVMQFRYGQARVKQPAKIWGVFPHRVVEPRHPLVWDVNTRFDVPHSRWNDVSRAQFEAAGLHVLVESEAAGVHLAVSPDGLRAVFFQGHPEYDTVSLLKEYKRDALLHAQGWLPEPPPFPRHYLPCREQAILKEYQERLGRAARAGDPLPEFPERLVAPRLDNTWHDTAEAVLGNWMGCVYQVTHRERRKPFMDGIDPADPLGLGWG
ncbi:MAG: homoserine O-succinyltransferase [Thiobacillaceae bacterium]|nr:homoserine O-succinyltransferase [Thiobacillaceae bacterium]